MRWVIGIVVVAVLVFLGYQYLGPGGEQVAEQPNAGAETGRPEGPRRQTPEAHRAGRASAGDRADPGGDRAGADGASRRDCRAGDRGSC